MMLKVKKRSLKDMIIVPKDSRLIGAFNFFIVLVAVYSTFTSAY